MPNNMNEEELKKQQAEADAAFDKLLNTPISEEELKLALADNDVKRMQMTIVRQKWTAQIKQTEMNIAALDEKVLELDMERAMLFRRTLNKPVEKDDLAAAACAKMGIVEKGE